MPADTHRGIGGKHMFENTHGGICAGPPGSPPTCAGPAAASRSLARLGSSNFRALIAEQRAKETRCAPAKRLEITARLPFHFVLVRLVLHPHKELLVRQLLASACKSSRAQVSEAAEEARSRRANLASRDARRWCLAHLRRVCFLG